MRRLQINHTTSYEYREPVTLLPHQLLLRPREGHDIRIESSILEISPSHKINWHRDVYGNSVAIVSFSEPTTTLKIASEVVIQHYVETPLDFVIVDYAAKFPFQYNPIERTDLLPYQVSLYPKDTPALKKWIRQVWQPRQLTDTFLFLDSLNKAIVDEFNYMAREEPGVQTPEQTLEKGSGSCRDFATLFIEACRYVGLAARFVSGYLHTPASEQGHGATHAWSEVYLPGAGWKGFDSTSGNIVGSDQIAVAVNRDPEAIPPVSGNFVGPLEPPPIMRVQVKVNAIK
jgi:transglutaminase-like putative cysteine protease